MALARRQTNTKANKAILIGGGVLVALLLLLFLLSMGSDKRAVKRVVDQVNINYYVGNGETRKLVNLMSNVNLAGCPSDFKQAYLNVIYKGRDAAGQEGDSETALAFTGGAYEIGKELGGEEAGLALGAFSLLFTGTAALIEHDEETASRNDFLNAVRYLERVAIKYEVKM